MQSQTFKRSLTPKRTDFSFKSAVFDYAAIRKAAAPNPFGITPETKPLTLCTNAGCTAAFNPNTGLWGAGCKGFCYG